MVLVTLEDAGCPPHWAACVLFCTNWQEFNSELCTQVQDAGLGGKEMLWDVQGPEGGMWTRPWGHLICHLKNLPGSLGCGQGGPGPASRRTADIFTDVLLILDIESGPVLIRSGDPGPGALLNAGQRPWLGETTTPPPVPSPSVTAILPTPGLPGLGVTQAPHPPTGGSWGSRKCDLSLGSPGCSSVHLPGPCSLLTPGDNGGTESDLALVPQGSRGYASK